MAISETKRWVIGICVTGTLGTVGILKQTGMLDQWLGSSGSGGGKEPQTIQVVIDPKNLKMEGSGVSLAALTTDLGADASQEEKKKARDEALAQAKKDDTLKEMFKKQINATKEAALKRGGMVDDQKIETLLADDPASFFASEPEVVEEVVDGKPQFFLKVQFDEGRLAEAMTLVQELIEKFKCPGSDHAHKVMVLYTATGPASPRDSNTARTAASAVESWIGEKGFQVFDQASVEEFYRRIESQATMELGDADSVKLAVDLNKQACYYFFVSVTVTSQGGGQVTQVKAELSVRCQDPEGKVLGSSKKQGIDDVTGPVDPATIDSTGAEIVEDILGAAMGEMWRKASPAWKTGG